jgi:WASH complex subunit strumpellin
MQEFICFIISSILFFIILFLFYRAILCEIAKQENNNETEPAKSELLHELSMRLDWAGISDPHNKVYIKPPKIDNIALIIFLFTVSQLNKLSYCKNTG